jgi:hypothetical protein
MEAIVLTEIDEVAKTAIKLSTSFCTKKAFIISLFFMLFVHVDIMTQNYTNFIPLLATRPDFAQVQC